MTAPAQTPISLDLLKSYLWGAAVLLRGQIDAAGYKEYIFPLVFFKRICDVHDEEYETYLEEGNGNVDYALCQEYTVDIPEGSHWRDIRNTPENIGTALVAAFLRIEQANPAIKTNDGRTVGGLAGIFGKKRSVDQQKHHSGPHDPIPARAFLQTLSLPLRMPCG